MDRSKNIFGNKISNKHYKKSLRSKKKYIKKFGDDSNVTYNLGLQPLPALSSLNTNNIVITDNPQSLKDDKGIIVGNIRMGFGHYRISMAIASAANAMGYNPYWLDLNSFKETTGGKIINHSNNLYSLGSRLSQKSYLFNKLFWDPLNSEGFKKLSFNACDQKNAELMTSVFKQIPKDMPFIATHVWPAQAAIHAGVERVINVIPDNWPMALHLAEGSIHTVQTPSSYLGYRMLKGMDGKKILNAMPHDSIYEVGHYIDHELVSNIDIDCERRLNRLKNNKAKRFLLTVGGAGAQKEIFSEIINKLIPLVKKEEAVIYLNVGDHRIVYDELLSSIPELKSITTEHFNNWNETVSFAENAMTSDITGVHAFYNDDIFAAVYATNLLMRSSDILVTKPSELAFYPIPKLMIKHVGGHEVWGAITAAELGDGTIECDTKELTTQMIDLMLGDDAILSMMCNKIVDNNKIGIYNGAYNAVKLAVSRK